jgi:hypothetical protein
MPDFDTNEDHRRLGDSSGEDAFKLPKLRPRFAPRARQLASWQCMTHRAAAPRKTPSKLNGRPSRAALHRACDAGRGHGRFAVAPSRRRRLWTKCLGRFSGSQS